MGNQPGCQGLKCEISVQRIIRSTAIATTREGSRFNRHATPDGKLRPDGEKFNRKRPPLLEKGREPTIESLDALFFPFSVETPTSEFVCNFDRSRRRPHSSHLNFEIKESPGKLPVISLGLAA